MFQVYTLSVAGDRLIVGTAGRRVLVWDLRNMGYVQQRRESSLKYQTRCIRAFPNKQVRAVTCKDCNVYIELSVLESKECVCLCVAGLCAELDRGPSGCRIPGPEFGGAEEEIRL